MAGSNPFCQRKPPGMPGQGCPYNFRANPGEAVTGGIATDARAADRVECPMCSPRPCSLQLPPVRWPRQTAPKVHLLAADIHLAILVTPSEPVMRPTTSILARHPVNSTITPSPPRQKGNERPNPDASLRDLLKAMQSVQAGDFSARQRG